MVQENISFKSPLHFKWLLKMAWRDSRRNRSRLFLFISSIILGIAALVAIYSFDHNLQNDINNQAKDLIGADLVLSASQPASDTIKPLIDSLGDQRSEERSFSSMIYFTRAQGTRLVQVRALQGGYPYYGKIETTPTIAGTSFRNGRNALVDKTLMLQFNAQIGDSIKVGETLFLITGILNKAPGQTGISTSVAPIVYIPLQYLQATGLSQRGSRINYNYYYKYDKPENINALTKKIEPRLEKERMSFETIETQKEDTSRSFEDLSGFLALVGFIALLLGCVGVASSIHVYIREKLSSIAVLRCLGVKSRQAFLIYMIQVVGIGIVGSIIGAALGTFIQLLLPMVLKDLLPVDISMSISWIAILQGIALGIIISLLFSLLPLISIRNISPLNTLRLSLEPEKFNDPVKWAVYSLIIVFILLFSLLHMDKWYKAFYFTGGILGAFLILYATGWSIIWFSKRFFPQSWNYLWRQGFANLFRPNNQTLILIVSVGLGTAFICTLYLVQNILIDRVTISSSSNQPNMILFDIQSKQKDSVAAFTRTYKLPIIQEVPVVTMRIEQINGMTADDVKKDSTLGFSERSFRGEYRSTYRDSLISSEKISSGKWYGRVNSPSDVIYISMDEGAAERSHFKVGDKLLFNVQGALIPTVIGSLRSVDWNRVQTNFRIVFPAGVLEDAPQFHVLITKVPSESVSAQFQQAMVRAFPNISIIDLGLLLGILDELLNKIGFVIKFMAGFSIITGVIVLIASVLTSKYQRIQESVLLRTLGASRKQILVITALEYFFLGALAAATGTILSLAASWALAKFSFESPFHPQFLPLMLIFGSVALLTMFVGIFNSRGVVNRPPLEILRKES